MFLRPFALIASGILTAAALVAAPMPVASAATTWVYPSTACPITADHGLQDCVDNASPGDTIVLQQEITADEIVIVNKSLTLMPDSPSLHPQLSYVAVRDQNVAGFEDIDVTLSGLYVSIGVEGYLRYGSLDQVTLTDLVVGKDTSNARGISISAEAPVDVDLEGSYARTTDSQRGSLEFFTQYAGGQPSTFRAVGNQLTQHDAPNQDSGSGISVEASGGSHIDAQIYNNQIWDVVGDSAGGASGIFLYPDTASSLNADVVGNTLDAAGSNGIALRNNVVAPAHVTLNVFNNIVGHAHGVGLYLSTENPGTLTFHGGYNDFFANDDPNLYEGEKPGPGNRKVNPRYVDRAEGDLSLRASSPLVDRGQACTAGGVVNLDAAGRGRVAGANVDMGAYELGAHQPTGKVRLGTKRHDTLRGTRGGDILCGFKGKDTLIGKGDSDFLDGGGGRDKLAGGRGRDWLYGGPGSDTACAPVAGDHQFSMEHTAAC